MVVVETSLSPDVFRLSRALSDRSGLAVLTSNGADAERFSFIACDPVEESTELLPASSGSGRGWAGFAAAPEWIGVIPYESLRGIERARWTPRDERPAPPITHPLWRRYDAVLRVDRQTGVVAVEGTCLRSAERLVSLASRPAPQAGMANLTPFPAEPPAAHAERIRSALSLIAAGDTYQVNLARRWTFLLRGRPFDLFAAVFTNSPVRFGQFIDLGAMQVASHSPELALAIEGDVIRSSPIKGTRPRGFHADEDTDAARSLEMSEKERAELTMAIDLHRNDLGRVARWGSVRLIAEPRVWSSRHVWSREATVVARKSPHVSHGDVVRALLPCGSVTGAPKVRAMEIIASLESARRGLYTGALGYVGRDGDVRLAMAIRTLEMAGSLVTYWAGGGIVAESDPALEVRETTWKAAHLAPFIAKERCDALSAAAASPRSGVSLS